MATLHERAARGETLSDVEIIDAHGHLGYCLQFPVAHSDANGMIEEMDRIGIDRIVISAFKAIATDYRAGNRLALETAKRHPGRFLVYLVANPHFADEYDTELEPLLDEPNVVGIKVHTELHQCPLADDRYKPVWQMAVRHNRPVLVHLLHPRDIEPLCTIAESYPELKLLVAHHAGPENIDKNLPVLKRHSNIYVDTCVSVTPFGILERLVGELGVTRVLFGTDMPYLNAGAQIGKVLFAKLGDDAKKRILCQNAREFFRPSRTA